jgi:3-hydroxyacyl-[acyl-carrier-protein] dehydratase
MNGNRIVSVSSFFIGISSFIRGFGFRRLDFPQALRLANPASHRYKRILDDRREEHHNSVKFNLIDHIELLSDQRIVAVKFVSLAEEYLADHFPTFPVLPGVMMLEAITQAAGWLMHHRTGFAKSMAVLKEAKNVKYGQFVAPGNYLKVDVELAKLTETGATFKANGFAGADPALQARVELSYFNLGDKQPELAELDGRLIEHHRMRWTVLNAGRTPSDAVAI